MLLGSMKQVVFVTFHPGGPGGPSTSLQVTFKMQSHVQLMGVIVLLHVSFPVPFNVAIVALNVRLEFVQFKGIMV